MEINMNVAVSKEEFFDFLYESLIADIKGSTGKTLAKEEITKGFKYKKSLKNKMNREGNVIVLIKELRLYSKYSAGFKSHQGENIITYDVESINDNNINVTYSEGFNAVDKMKDWNYNLLNFFYKRRARRKAKKNLKNIEKLIITNRGEI